MPSITTSNPIESLPTEMTALVLHGRETLRFEQRPVPTPLPGEVLLKISSVGVCGSDKHFYFEGRASSSIVVDPVVLGHEFGGNIVAVGSNVSTERIGQRVSVEPLIPNWESKEALSGRYNIDPNQKFFGIPGTDGALQQYLSVPAKNAFAIPDQVSDDAASMVETISVSLNGVRKANIGVGSRVLVAGGGPIGLFVAQLAFLHGATEVTLVEPIEGRRTAAAKIGCNVAEKLDDIDESHESFIDCTGVTTVRHDGCLKVEPGGTVVLIGVGEQDASLPMLAIMEREVAVRGVMRYSFTWPTVIQLLVSGKLDADSLVTRRLPFAQAKEAWTTPIANEVKTIIQVNV